MAQFQVTGYCDHCREQVWFRSREGNHLLHFFFSVLTAGLWIPVWLVFAFGRKRWYCSGCGLQLPPEDSRGLEVQQESVGSRLIRHFKNYQTLEPWPFCWRISLEGLVANVLVALPLSAWLPGTGHPELDESPGLFILVAVLAAPIGETLLFQSLVILLVRACRGSMAWSAIDRTRRWNA